jgi:hypothetical protein
LPYAAADDDDTIIIKRTMRIFSLTFCLIVLSSKRLQIWYGDVYVINGPVELEIFVMGKQAL